jgi:DNA invertase Pin-like site-specific DNA recombinase
MPSTNGHGPKRAILYARVSTDEQARSGNSLAQQLEALRDYGLCAITLPVRATKSSRRSQTLARVERVLRGQVWTV